MDESNAQGQMADGEMFVPPASPVKAFATADGRGQELVVLAVSRTITGGLYVVDLSTSNLEMELVLLLQDVSGLGVRHPEPKRVAETVQRVLRLLNAVQRGTQEARRVPSVTVGDSIQLSIARGPVASSEEREIEGREITLE